MATLTQNQTVTEGFTTISAEDFEVGYRYWSVRPGFESNWTVTAVEERTADVQVYRDGGWATPELIVIRYRDGRERTFERGEQVAIQGPWQTPA